MRRKGERMRFLRLGISECRQSGETDVGHSLTLSGVNKVTLPSTENSQGSLPIRVWGRGTGAFGGINTTEPRCFGENVGGECGEKGH